MPRTSSPHPLDDMPDDLLEEIRSHADAGPLTPEAVARLRQIVAQENGVVLSYRQAWEQARALLDLVKMLASGDVADEGPATR